MKIVSVINYKGGVGKTTVTANLGAKLADRGYKVLLVDLDPQSSLTFSFYTEPEWRQDLAPQLTIRRWFEEFIAGQGTTALHDLVVEPGKAKSHIRPNGGGLSLIASHLGLINVDLQLAGQLVGMGPNQTTLRHLEVHGRLADGLGARAFSKYDVALIDCPPNFNIVTKTAIIASSFLLIPSRPDHLSTLGINYLLSNVDELVDEYNNSIRMVTSPRRFAKARPATRGVVFTMVPIYAGRPNKTATEFIESTKRELNVPVFETTMRESNSSFARAPSTGVPVAVAAKVDEDVSYELEKLADEFILWVGLGKV